MCTQSASGFNGERGAMRSDSRAHSKSDQRSSTSHPISQLGPGAAQGRNRRHGVDDVAHGAQADHQHALRKLANATAGHRRREDCIWSFAESAALIVVRLLRSQERSSCCRRSVVEWSLGSPTISTRPP